MAAADKARFYLEQQAPTLNAWARANLFSPTEIHAITAKRSTFEHTLAARGSKPADYARYAEYETNLHALLRKRCARLGVKRERGDIANGDAQRTVFFILDRGTKKFPGDLGLWMQYIRFCQKEKASKKLAKVLTSCLRLRPREWGLWVLAAKWYAEEQGDMGTARGYMQRGLRFCIDERRLWLAYAQMEMVYLAKLAARRKILGVDEVRKEVKLDEDDNMITLPDFTAANLEPDVGRGLEEIDAAALQRLANAPAYTGAIPLAIFDAAMKQFSNSSEVAADFFDLVAQFSNVPTSKAILQHILSHLRSTAPESLETVLCESRMRLVSIDAVSAEFPEALGGALARLKSGLSTLPEKQKSSMAEGAVMILLPYLKQHSEMDEDVVRVLVASVNRYLRAVTAPRLGSTSKLADGVRAKGTLSAEEMLEMLHAVAVNVLH